MGKPNGLRAVPNNWCNLVNTMVKPCPACKEAGTVTSRWHLLVKHKISLPHINHIYKNDILPISLSTIQTIIHTPTGPIKIIRPQDRDVIRQKLKPIIDSHINNYSSAFATLVGQNSNKPEHKPLKITPFTPQPADENKDRLCGRKNDETVNSDKFSYFDNHP